MAKLADEDGIDIGGEEQPSREEQQLEHTPTLRDRMLLAVVSGPDFARERWESLDQWANAMWAAADALMAARDEEAPSRKRPPPKNRNWTGRRSEPFYPGEEVLQCEQCGDNAYYSPCELCVDALMATRDEVGMPSEPPDGSVRPTSTPLSEWARTASADRQEER